MVARRPHNAAGTRNFALAHHTRCLHDGATCQQRCVAALRAEVHRVESRRDVAEFLLRLFAQVAHVLHVLCRVHTLEFRPSRKTRRHTTALLRQPLVCERRENGCNSKRLLRVEARHRAAMRLHAGVVHETRAVARQNLVELRIGPNDLGRIYPSPLFVALVFVLFRNQHRLDSRPSDRRK